MQGSGQRVHGSRRFADRETLTAIGRTVNLVTRLHFFCELEAAHFERSGKTMTTHLRRIISALRRHGLLLKQDRALPNVVGLVTGEVLSGSWWSHPRAQEIFAVLHELVERAEVLETKLIGGKVTFVHERLWPAWLAVATSGESWQQAGLSAAARQLLTEVRRAGEREGSGAAVKELERRLLVRSEQRHTESGRHVLVLESWPRWAKRCDVHALPTAEGKTALELAASSLGAPIRALPWRAERPLATRRRRLGRSAP